MATQASGGKTADKDDLEAQVAQLRADLTKLTDTIAEIGRGKAESLRGEAADRTEEAVEAAREALRSMNARAGQLERDAAATIRERPFLALGIAAGVGFLAALLARR